VYARSLLAEELSMIGITVRYTPLSACGSDRVYDPATRTPFALTLGWGLDFPNAANTFDPLFGSATLGSDEVANYNTPLTGATSTQLSSWGYAIDHVPSLDERIAACIPLVFEAQQACWARLDQYVMTSVVPWVPLFTFQTVRIVSARVRDYTVDVWTALPALDQLSLAPEASS
jgi:hypothetical protein